MKYVVYAGRLLAGLMAFVCMGAFALSVSWSMLSVPMTLGAIYFSTETITGPTLSEILLHPLSATFSLGTMALSWVCAQLFAEIAGG